jgi:putative hydrolase of the HAD superfamily
VSQSLLVPPATRAIFFDAVGTLLHPDPWAPAVYADVGRRHGSKLDTATITARFRSAFSQEEQLDRQSDWQTSEAREVERWRHIVATVLDDVRDPGACFQVLFDHFGRPASWRCDSDTELVLRELARRGFELGMASNYDSRLRTVVAGLPALASIRRLVISSEVGWRKPAQEFFSAMLREVGMSSEEVLFVGDDPANDYEGARAAGIHALLLDAADRSPSAGRSRIRRLRDLLG